MRECAAARVLVCVCIGFGMGNYKDNICAQWGQYTSLSRAEQCEQIERRPKKLSEYGSCNAHVVLQGKGRTANTGQEVAILGAIIGSFQE